MEKKEYREGQLLDWTREGDDSPYFGAIIYDRDLDEVVCYEQNGGFKYLGELKNDGDFVVIEKGDIEEYLKGVREKYPDEGYSFEWLSNFRQ